MLYLFPICEKNEREEKMDTLFQNVIENFQWQMLIMWAIGGLLIFLAIKKEMEPSLLLPIGFGAILVNLPLSGAITQVVDGVTERGALSVLYDAGIANELFPLRKPDGKMERVATPKNTNVYLEAVEEAENEGNKPKEVRNARLAGLPKREHPKRILGYCRKWYIDTYHNKRKTCTQGIL